MNPKVIDVSGFGHSGKTAVSDLLREFEGVQVHDHSFEFGLMRLPDGILDLEYHLCGNWSPLRSDRAIKRFRKLCQILSSGYNKNLNERFLEKSLNYLDSLIEGKLFVDAWFDPLYEPTPANPVRQILKRMHLWGIAKNLAGIFSSRSNTEPRKCEVFLSSPEDFRVKTKKYLEEILGGGITEMNKVVVTNNMMEPFSPERSLKFFDDAYCVVVERDPRDIFASVLRYEKSFVPPFEAKNERYSMEFLKNLKKEMLGTDDIESFLVRQRIYYRNTKFRESDRIIRVKYEDLVLNYQETIDKLLAQIDLDQKDHLHKKSFFDPEKSRQNVGIWKKLKDHKEIKEIERELPYLLYT
jgi:hypothetical protein